MTIDIDKITAATFALREKIVAIDPQLADAFIPFVGDLLTAPINGQEERLPGQVQAWKEVVGNPDLDDDFAALDELLS